MIIVRLEGGLGNQMFQYAFGRSISLEKNCELLIDINFFENQVGKLFDQGLSRRVFELNIFQLQSVFWDNKVCNLFPNKILNRIYLKIEKLIGIKALIYEKIYGYDDSIFSQIKRHTYLSGHWQSPLYFEKYRTILLDDFKFKLPQNRNLILESLIQTTNSVSIHVRRGDYINSKDANMIHGICSEAYYKSASDILLSVQNNINWFIFSDDIEWCKENFKWLENCNFVDSANSPAFYDMFLMSICKHNIIANSTFSWWGAWLNQNENKIVVGPSRWFSDSKLNNQIKGIIPNTWISI